jgi:hypothetical protein
MSEMRALVSSSASLDSLMGGRMLRISGTSEKYLDWAFFVIERKKEANASTAAIRTCVCKQEMLLAT